MGVLGTDIRFQYLDNLTVDQLQKEKDEIEKELEEDQMSIDTITRSDAALELRNDIERNIEKKAYIEKLINQKKPCL